MGLFGQDKKKIMSIEEAVQGRANHISFIIDLLEESSDGEKSMDLLSKIYAGEFLSKSDLYDISNVVNAYLDTIPRGLFTSRGNIDHMSFVLKVCEGINYSLNHMDY